MKHTKFSLLLISVFFLLLYHTSAAQEESAPQPVVSLKYFNNNNNVQYLILEGMMKQGRTFTPQKNKEYQLYLDSINAGNLIAKLKTDGKGKAKAFLPPSLKTAWDASAQHTFIVMDGKEEVLSDFMITKSNINLDTATTDGVRAITASVMKWENNAWVPAAEVEMKVGVERYAGRILSAGDEETYTTDSSGMVTVELTKDSLPGDLKGNYVIAAQVQDNDEFGNLLAEKTVKWGIAQKADNTFFEQRALWTTRDKTPIWLLIMAYSIVTGVWGTLIYLVFQIIKIKKIGNETPPNLQKI